MRYYRVIKEKLNVRNRPFINDSTYIGLLQKDELFKGDINLVKGDTPSGSESDLWVKDHLDRYVSYAGVIEDQLPSYITDYGIEEIWNKTQGEGITVALLDTGCNTGNVTITKRISLIDNELNDSVGHGTLMASLIAGKGTDLFGLAPKADILSIKLTTDGKINNENYVKALKETLANMPIAIINNSLTVENPTESLKNELIDLCTNLTDMHNVILVAAIGNNFTVIESPNSFVYPAVLSKTISCAGVDKKNGTYRLLADSNYWKKLTIAAPGSFPPNGHGSSHACAYVSGLLALIASYYKKKNKRFSIEEALLSVDSFTDTVVEDSDEAPLVYKTINKDKLQFFFNSI